MKTRILVIAVIVALCGAALTWLTLWPLLRPLWHWALNGGEAPAAAVLVARISSTLPALLLLDVIALAVVAYLVLDITVGRPLRRTEETVEQLEHLQLELPFEAHSAGPLLSRVQASLSRMADALRQEQALTRDQLKELRETNERLSKTQSELVRSEQLALLGRLAAGVAHEVGNPLMGILGYLSLLKGRAGLEPEIADYVVRIEAEVQRIDGIVRGLLELGRPPRATPTEQPLLPIVQSVIELFKSGREHAKVQVSLAVDAALTALIDRALLSQVLLNLLLNASQAMNGEGRVAVSASQRDAQVQLTVEDSGPGLSPEVKARLFEPFFTTRQGGKGTGLGLAISRQLVESLRGQLLAENRAEGGARFTLTLPRTAHSS